MQPVQNCNKDIQNTNPSSKELVPSSKSSQHSFSPFSANSLQIDSSQGFGYGCVYYSQKHNMIIASPRGKTIQFYDATTLLPLKDRKSLKVDDVVKKISAQEKTDILIIQSSSGSLYLYNIDTHTMEETPKDSEADVSTVEFVNPTSYAFSMFQSNELYIGSLENREGLKYGSVDSDSRYLHRLPKSPLLLSSLDNGSVLIYRTDRLPQLPIIGRFQGERVWESVVFPQSFMMNGKEYVATIAQEKAIEIWGMTKGRMKLVKVIQTEKRICSFVYLERYKMIAVVYPSRYVEFFKVLSGKLEKRFEMKINDARSMFLMKDRNMIGVVSFYQGIIEFIQLQ